MNIFNLSLIILLILPKLALAYRPKAWTTDCKTLGQYSVIANFKPSSFQYVMNGYSMRLKFFETGACDKLKYQIELVGNLFGANDKDAKPDMFNHNLKQVQLLLVDSDEVKSANDNKLCGLNNWEHGIYQDISGKECLGLKFPKVNTRFYDFAHYQSEDFKYTFSWFPSFHFNKAPNERPMTYDQSSSTIFWAVSENTFNRVKRDMKIYEDHLATQQKQFEAHAKNIQDVEWVKTALHYMVDRFFYTYPAHPRDEYSSHEKKEAWLYQKKRSKLIRVENIKLFKEILKTHGWINRSKFGEDAEKNALYLGHLSQDLKLQRQIVKKMATLLKTDEINKPEFADLYDDIAASYDKPSMRRKQRYGIHGLCKGEVWKPFTIEDEKNVDQRRAEVGLEPLKNHIEYMSSSCKQQLLIDTIEPVFDPANEFDQ